MTRPNILLLMADQHRADAIGVARKAGGENQPALKTPNLDRLCREGVRFARAYTESPVCVSARSTLLTGLLPHQSGVFDNGYKVGPDAVTLPKLLRERGYHCQAVGKMHFFPVREHHGLHRLWLSEEIPRTPEEDEFLSELINAGWGHVEEPHGVRHELYYIPQVSQLPEERHTTAWTGRKTVEYLEEHVKERKDQPFFCWTSFIKPHPPFDPPVPWHTLYRPTDLPLGNPVRTDDEPERHTYYHRTQNRFKWTDTQPERNLLDMMRAYYAGAVSFIDYWVGQVLETLERLGLREDTLVLYVADHGEYLGDHYAYGKRGFHDPPSRIPFVMSWPGVLPVGEVRQELVGLADVLPACVSAADGHDAGTLPAGKDVWLGQLAEREKGLYCAMDAEWKYVYSAPDDREYLMHSGESMFVVLEGLLRATIVFPGETQPSDVGHIQPGGFFGEMSLLTGAPRTATVTAMTDSLVYEVTKGQIEELFVRGGPDVADTLSAVIADRRLCNDAAYLAATRAEQAQQRADLTSQILVGIKHFFSNVFTRVEQAAHAMSGK